MNRLYLFLLLLFVSFGCSTNTAKDFNNSQAMKSIYFAGGCFWGTEHFFGMIKGVVSTEVGYANSRVSNPTYKQVCSGNTGAVETVEVVYDKSVISLEELINLYFKTIYPLSINRQGGDVGTQYRTGIYYVDDIDSYVIARCINNLATTLNAKPAIEVLPLSSFYKAEDYHQDYLAKNPGGYCHIDPSLFRIAREYQSSTKNDSVNK